MRIDDSPFERTVAFIGAETEDRNEVRVGTVSTSHSLISLRHRQSGNVGHHLTWIVIYRGFNWRFYTGANDNFARPLDIGSVRRDVLGCPGGNCSYLESMAVTLDEGRLRAALREGRDYCVQFYARSGPNHVICLSPEDISAQFEAIAAYRANNPLPSRAPAIR